MEVFDLIIDLERLELKLKDVLILPIEDRIKKELELIAVELDRIGRELEADPRFSWE